MISYLQLLVTAGSVILGVILWIALHPTNTKMSASDDEYYDIDSEDEFFQDIDSENDGNIDNYIENKDKIIMRKASLSSNDSDDESDADTSDSESDTDASKEREWEASDFEPELFEFTKSSGIQSDVPITINSEEIDYFELFFTKDIIDTIVSETNRHASKLTRESKIHEWVDTTADEMWRFISIVVLMGVVVKDFVELYWTKDPFLCTPFFEKVFSSERFFNILRALHFSSGMPPSVNRLYKIEKILNPLKTNFKKVFSPSKNLYLGESIILKEGCLSFRTHILNDCFLKTKICALCDIPSGYVLDIYPYAKVCNADVNKPVCDASTSIIQKLVSDYTENGHKIFIDNWHASPLVLDYLHEHKTNACGIVRKSKQQMPKFPSNKSNHGAMQCLRSNKVLVIKWLKRKSVLTITDCHKGIMMKTNIRSNKTGERKIAPDALVDYVKVTKTMKKIDFCNLDMHFMDTEQRSLKWYKKLFLRLLEISIFNAFILFVMNKKPKRMSYDKFRQELVSQIIERYQQPMAN